MRRPPPKTKTAKIHMPPRRNTATSMWSMFGRLMLIGYLFCIFASQNCFYWLLYFNMIDNECYSRILQYKYRKCIRNNFNTKLRMKNKKKSFAHLILFLPLLSWIIIIFFVAKCRPSEFSCFIIERNCNYSHHWVGYCCCRCWRHFCSLQKFWNWVRWHF